MRGIGVRIETAAGAGLASAVVDFVTREQPGWAVYFRQALAGQKLAGQKLAEGRGEDVLVARRAGSAEVLGTCLVESPSPAWALRLRQPVGAPGAILTGEAARGEGIGMALTARATEMVKARGCQTAFLGWTWLVDWYGKLGYRVWQEYVMSQRAI